MGKSTVGHPLTSSSNLMTKSVSRFQTDKNKFLASKLDGQFTLVDGAVQYPYSGHPLLGEGSFGVVKLGRLKQLGTDVAVKCPKISMFDGASEAKILMSLNGSDYFPYFYGIYQGCLVMQLIWVFQDGDYKTITVYSELQNFDSPITCSSWVRISWAIACAVQFLHSKNILHNDLKEDNILLKFSNSIFTPVIIDFGKATHLSNP